MFIPSVPNLFYSATHQNTTYKLTTPLHVALKNYWVKNRSLTELTCKKNCSFGDAYLVLLKPGDNALEVFVHASEIRLWF